MKQRAEADRAEYAAIVQERERNVVVDAGAGTGKTTALVDRWIQLVAPEDVARPALAVDRVAAITFTRRAAGELRLRIGQELVAERARERRPARRRRLEQVQAGLDQAWIGTIHSFCDRLLRLRPVELDLSPSYQIVEDTHELVQETLNRLLHGAQRGALADECGAGADVAAAERTICDFLAAGMPVETREYTYARKFGLDQLIADFLEHRDRPPVVVDVSVPDAAPTHALTRTLGRQLDALDGDTIGHRLCRVLRRALADVLEADRPVALLAALLRAARVRPQERLGLKADCGGDAAVFRFAKDWGWAGPDKASPALPYREALCAPWFAWMGARLAQLAPVTVRIYEAVKRRHSAVDQIDLLLRVRDGLRADLDLRGSYQQRFDHLLVDEFQDTDPLQLEILFYLAEAVPQARDWRDVHLAPGRLTLVGDPKQSIYRFRRADIRTYEQARRRLLAQGALAATLSATYRSRPELVEVYNRRFEEILGSRPEGADPVDAGTGQAYYSPLAPSGTVKGRQQACVRLLPYMLKDMKAEQGRPLEAEVLARWIRGAVAAKSLVIRGPEGEVAAGFGDITVLARSTHHVPTLLGAFRRFGVPYTARGGKLFLSEPQVRQFLLALRALADPKDGPAQMALYRPPFFALDYADLLAAQSEDATTAAAERGRAARTAVAELRRMRLSRPPGATARDLLERAGCAAALALGPNGAQTLTLLHELIHELERLAAVQGWDYDAVTAELRLWVDDPGDLAPPAAVDEAAVRVMTVHAAKGLEFPVVVLWDGFDQLSRPASEKDAWRVSEDGACWAIQMGEFEAEFPPGSAALQHEKDYSKQERHRLFYVAATRARDWLILGLPEVTRGAHRANAQIALDLPAALASREPMAGNGPGASWAQAIEPVEEFRTPSACPALDRELADVRAQWAAAAGSAAAPVAAPVAASTAGDRLEDLTTTAAEGEPEPPARRPSKRESRFGPAFGETVHEVLGAVLTGAPASVARLVAAAAQRHGMSEQIAAAEADVARAQAALAAAGVLGSEFTRRSEVPVVRHDGAGHLIVGSIDLLLESAGAVWVVDFKTDRWTPGATEREYAGYAQQLRTYRDLLQAAGVIGARTVTLRLLFTETGEWLGVR